LFPKRDRCSRATPRSARWPFERHCLAVDLVDELDRVTSRRKALRARIRTAVAAAGTTLTDIVGGR
jgi:hypothetical protein